MSTLQPSQIESYASLSDSDESITATTASINNVTKKRKVKKSTHPGWQHSREATGSSEPSIAGKGARARKIWYCKYDRCDGYHCLSTAAAEHHLKTVHGLIFEDRHQFKAQKARQQDLRQVISNTTLQKDQQKQFEALETLRQAANPAKIHQALLRLIVHHDLPLNAVEWPELYTLVYTINHTAVQSIWQSHSTVARKIDQTFTAKKLQLKHVLQQSKSLIHITTDTWHAPNFKEFQAINATFVTAEGRLQKALLDLAELPEGHAGATVAPFVLRALEDFEIKERLGYITADNHGANDTMCRAISQELTNWQPQERRLRCLGHIINLAVQAFFFAYSQEAVELAISQADELPASSIDEQLQELSDKENAGWIKSEPLQEVLLFVRTLRRSDRLYNSFKLLANRTIRAPNDTRWNSYFTTFTDAVLLKSSYIAFVASHADQLSNCELSNSEWQLIETTVTFLEPFKEATKQCEGDYITLDKVQSYMDAIIDHLSTHKQLYKNNTALSTALVTSWYVFDKYYKLIDESGAYTAAILLHPNRRHSYLQSAWQKAWIKPGIERARQLWLRYKEEVVDEVIDTENLSSYDRFRHRIAAKQFSKRGANDEFERFINSPSEAINMPVLDWWQLE